MSTFYPDLSGNSPFRGVTVGDPKTKALGQQRYVLASNLATLAVGARTAPVYNMIGGSYIFFASFAGTSPSLQLQYQGDDGVWYNIDVARTTSGSGTTGVVIGEGATVALLNSGANAITSIYAGLS